MVAESCVLGVNLKIPMALDDMGNTVENAYLALPDRLYVIDPEGRITYQSDPGPWGFDVDAWERAIAQATKASL